MCLWLLLVFRLSIPRSTDLPTFVTSDVSDFQGRRTAPAIPCFPPGLLRASLLSHIPRIACTSPTFSYDHLYCTKFSVAMQWGQARKIPYPRRTPQNEQKAPILLTKIDILSAHSAPSKPAQATTSPHFACAGGCFFPPSCAAFHPFARRREG